MSFLFKRTGRLDLVLLASMLFLACGQEVQDSASAPPALSRSQMETTVSQALKERDPVVRMKTLATALESLDQENAEGAAEAFRANRPRVKEFDVHPFMSRWASFDPEAAMEFPAEGLKKGRPQSRAYQSIVSAWVESGDGEGAYEFLIEMEEQGLEMSEPFRFNLIQSLIVNREFDLAMPMLEEIPESKERNALLLSLTFDLAEEGVPYLIDWSESISLDAPNNLKAAVFAQSMSLVAQSDPESAAAWYEKEGYQDYVRGDTFALILVEWIKFDPVAAMEWAIRQPPSDARDAAVRGAIYRWQMDDSETSEPWIREHISDPAMEVALYPFAQWLVYQNPVEALAWALRVPQKMERYYVVQQSFLRWRRVDQEAAMAWLETADLPDDLRSEIDGLIVMEGQSKSMEASGATEEVAAEEADVSGQP